MTQPYYGHEPPHRSSPYQAAHAPVQAMVVKERGFNPITFLIHLFAWIFLHWWLTALTLGLWLLVAIPVTFIGWKVKRTIPVQQNYQPPNQGVW